MLKVDSKYIRINWKYFHEYVCLYSCTIYKYKNMYMHDTIQLCIDTI